MPLLDGHPCRHAPPRQIAQRTEHAGCGNTQDTRCVLQHLLFPAWGGHQVDLPEICLFQMGLSADMPLRVRWHSAQAHRLWQHANNRLYGTMHREAGRGQQVDSSEIYILHMHMGIPVGEWKRLTYSSIASCKCAPTRSTL